MALANVSYTANGSTTLFVVSFSYIETSHITVKVDGVVTTAYTFNGTDVDFTVAPANGVVVLIERDSDISQKLAIFGDGSNLLEEDLNNNTDQGIFLQQETRDLIDTINTENAAVLGRLVVNEADIDELELNQDDLVTLSGVAENESDLGTFTGTTITDSSTVKVALQEIETDLEANVSADGLVTTHSDVTDAGSGIIITAAERTKLDGITAGSDVAKVGTPVDNQIGVWTGDGTIEGEANFTYNSTLDHLDLTGEMDIHHTAVATNEHALEIDVNAAGFGDVKAIDIDYITGAVVDGQDEAVILVNIDESSATGGDVTALEVLATEGSAKVIAVLSGIGIDPLEHLSGAFTDMDSALVNATDRLAEFISDASDIEMFTADNDTVTIGNAVKFQELEFLLSTVSSKNIQPTFEYSTGVGTWTVFTPVDGTNGMLNNGVIAWLDSDLTGHAVGTGSEYLVRITRTRNGSITSPIEDKVQIGVATQYCWDKNADLKINALTFGTSTQVTSILDEDTLSSDSATALATQQSIKAYIDASVDDTITTRGDLITGDASGLPSRLAIGTANQILVSDGTDLAWGTGGGDTVGAASSTDNAVVKFDLATGKVIQNSNVVIDDDGRISQTGLGDSVYLGVGAGAVDDLTTNNNVGVGKDALAANTSSRENVAIGTGALATIGISSNFNVAVGSQALGLASTGAVSNVAIGYQAGAAINIGDNNVFVGRGAGGAVTSTSSNTFIGKSAGYTTTTGAGNIAIGSLAVTTSATASNELSIGNLITGNMSTGDLDIISTTALGLPKGTTAQRPTGADGDIRHNSDLNSFEGYSNGAWGSLGGSGGGLDSFYSEDFVGTSASDFTSGNNATYDNGGTINGTLSDDTVTNISGTKSLKYVQAASSLNDFVKSPVISLDVKQKGQTVGLTMYYTYDGDSDDIKIVGYDNTGSEVMTLASNLIKASSTAQRLSVQFPVPSDSASISWGFQTVVENIGAILVVDDVEISTNPFVYKDTLINLEVVGAGNGGTSITADVTNVDFTEVTDIGYGGDNWNGTQFTVPADGLYDLVGSMSLTSSVQRRVNLWISGVKDKEIGANDAASSEIRFSYQRSFVEGEVLSLRSNATATLSNSLTQHHISITAVLPTENIIAYNSRNEANSMVRLHTGNGHGSTNTKIRRFTTAVTNVGNAITYADSSTLGATFTINEDGFYSIAYSDNFASGAADIGLSLNSTELTTSVIGITAADRLTSSTTGAAAFASECSWSGLLSKDDIVRVHSGGSALAATGPTFTISKIGVGDLLGVPVPRTAYIKDVKTSGTNGGSSSVGINTRDLNTLEGDTEFVSLSTNQFTLSSGKYTIDVDAPLYNGNNHKVRLYNITNSSYDLEGIGMFARSGTGDMNISSLIGEIVITALTTYEIRHYVQTAAATDGLGRAISQGSEVYTTVKITKIS